VWLLGGVAMWLWLLRWWGRWASCQAQHGIRMEKARKGAPQLFQVSSQIDSGAAESAENILFISPFPITTPWISSHANFSSGLSVFGFALLFPLRDFSIPRTTPDTTLSCLGLGGLGLDLRPIICIRTYLHLHIYAYQQWWICRSALSSLILENSRVF